MEDWGRTPWKQKNGIILELGGEGTLQSNNHNLVKNQQKNKFTNTRTILHQTLEGNLFTINIKSQFIIHQYFWVVNVLLFYIYIIGNNLQ